MIVVPSISPSSTREAERLLRILAGRVALAELRVDGMRRPETGRLLRGRRPPVIVTCRSRAEGGRFSGSRQTMVSRLKEALSEGAEFVDVEERLGTRAIGDLSAVGGPGRLILSRHYLSRPPHHPEAILRRMAVHRPAIVKIAYTAKSYRDTVAVPRLLGLAARLKQPAVVLPMGEFGTYARILQGLHGGALTFTSFGPGGPTAPGQIGLEEMHGVYRPGNINTRTRIFGLVGNPVRLSLGVRYHNAVFAERGLNAVYLNFLVDDLGVFMASTASICSGFSVTMPFKLEIIPYLDRLHSSSRVSGCVNTVVRLSGETVGVNTDHLAFLSLLKSRSSPRGKHLLVLGTGGTARTVSSVAASVGARLTVAGRNYAGARRLARSFGGSAVTLGEAQGLAPDILVNATPVGMTQTSVSRGKQTIFPSRALSRSTLVCDFANPPYGRTRLVDAARDRGCRVITGEEIFISQAELQSGYFFRSGRPS
jgi:3-dehydroquinate dehydratase/shikimate dehydrogenase